MSRLANNWVILSAKLALVVGCALVASRATASCGDYVQIGNPAHAKLHTPAKSSETTHRLPNDNPPCSGPNCSGHPVHYPAVPASGPPTSGAEQWVFLGLDFALLPLAKSGKFVDAPSPCPVSAPFRIERPPRSFA